ncbi:MAG TPA: hypothetical protein VLV83_23780, partial [Acidobacteriota bacterium]|nr:hypothetical protein [Acidobacteriota bacterium]
LRDAIGRSNTAFQENVALTNEAEKRFGTFRAEATKLWQQLKDGAIEVFDETLRPILMDTVFPAFETLLATLEAVIGVFTRLPEPVQRLAVVSAGAAASVGPLALGMGSLLSVMGSVSQSLSTNAALPSGLKNLQGLIGGMTNQLGNLTAFLTSPWGIALAVAAAAVVVFKDEIAELIVDTAEYFGLVEAGISKQERLTAQMGMSAASLENFAGRLRGAGGELGPVGEEIERVISKLREVQELADQPLLVRIFRGLESGAFDPAVFFRDFEEEAEKAQQEADELRQAILLNSEAFIQLKRDLDRGIISAEAYNKQQEALVAESRRLVKAMKDLPPAQARVLKDFLDLQARGKSAEGTLAVLGSRADTLLDLWKQGVVALDPYIITLINASKAAERKAGALEKVNEELDKLKKQFQDNIRPAAALSREIQKLINLQDKHGNKLIPVNHLYAVYIERLLEAAKRQKEMTGELDAGTNAVLDYLNQGQKLPDLTKQQAEQQDFLNQSLDNWGDVLE